MRKQFEIDFSCDSTKTQWAGWRIGTSSEAVWVQRMNFSYWRIIYTVLRKISFDKLKMAARIAEFCALRKSRQAGEVNYA